MDERIQQIRNYLLNLQNQICQTLEQEDGQSFISDNWSKKDGGGGLTKILSNGHVFEQAGVNFSHVYGNTMPSSATEIRPELANAPFNAMGISLVIHPKNPYVPTSHANIRFFIAHPENHPPVWWFGGGMDLTPYYGFAEDCKHWHQTCFTACEPFGEQAYWTYKEMCDEYFFLPHRNEHRGIGGLFFEDLNTPDFETCLSFIKRIGESFIPAYLPIVQKRRATAYGEKERQFQLYRRGRYVEFNLIHDRGTLFGLQSNGRTESILMSLPPLVRWEYNYQPQKNTPEAELYSTFLTPRNWLA